MDFSSGARRQKKSWKDVYNNLYELGHECLDSGEFGTRKKNHGGRFTVNCEKDTVL